MFEKHLVTTIGAIVLGVGILLQPTGSQAEGAAAAPGRAPLRAVEPKDAAPSAVPSAAPAARSAGKVMQLDKGMRKNLTKMPDSQRIQVGGQEMTIGQLRKQNMAEQKKAVAKIKAMGAGNPAGVEALQAEFDKAEEARLNAANAKVMTEMAKINVGPAAPTNSNGAAEAIKKEAVEIQGRQRAGTATPEDAARADELFNQYQQLK